MRLFRRTEFDGLVVATHEDLASLGEVEGMGVAWEADELRRRQDNDSSVSTAVPDTPASLPSAPEESTPIPSTTSEVQEAASPSSTVPSSDGASLVDTSASLLPTDIPTDVPADGPTDVPTDIASAAPSTTPPPEAAAAASTVGGDSIGLTAGTDTSDSSLLGGAATSAIEIAESSTSITSTSDVLATSSVSLATSTEVAESSASITSTSVAPDTSSVALATSTEVAESSASITSTSLAPDTSSVALASSTEVVESSISIPPTSEVLAATSVAVTSAAPEASTLPPTTNVAPGSSLPPATSIEALSTASEVASSNEAASTTAPQAATTSEASSTEGLASTTAVDLKSSSSVSLPAKESSSVPASSTVQSSRERISAKPSAAESSRTTQAAIITISSNGHGLSDSDHQVTLISSDPTGTFTYTSNIAPSAAADLENPAFATLSSTSGTRTGTFTGVVGTETPGSNGLTVTQTDRNAGAMSNGSMAAIGVGAVAGLLAIIALSFFLVQRIRRAHRIAKAESPPASPLLNYSNPPLSPMPPLRIEVGMHDRMRSEENDFWVSGKGTNVNEKEAEGRGYPMPISPLPRLPKGEQEMDGYEEKGKIGGGFRFFPDRERSGEGKEVMPRDF